MKTGIQKGGMTLVIERSRNLMSMHTTCQEGKFPAGMPPNPRTINRMRRLPGRSLHFRARTAKASHLTELD